MCGTKFLYSKTSTHARIMQLRCRSWLCPRCRPRRQNRLKWQALAGNPITFITLTCNPHLYESPGDAARAMTKAWRAARRVIEQHHGGRKAEYLTVVETTQRGWPHLHVLTTRRWIDQRWLSDLWLKLSGAHIVDIRRVTNTRMAASYVAKYLGKAPQRFDRCKRYYFTRGYLPRIEGRNDKFDWSTATHETIGSGGHLLVTALLGSGSELLEASDGYWIFSHPPPCVRPSSTEFRHAVA
jgi:hypothetical protein